MSVCNRCEVLEEFTLQSPCMFYLNLPLNHSRIKLFQELKKKAIDFKLEQESGYVAISVQSSQEQLIAEIIVNSLTALEIKDSMGFMLPIGVKVTMGVFSRVLPLDKLVGKLRASKLIDILKNKRLKTFFQPIVVSSTHEIYGYECLLRAYDENGNLVAPGDLFAMAKSADLLFYLDREARITAINSAFQNEIKSNIFINFNPTSIYDPEFCLKTTVAIVEKHNIAHKQIIFEVIESEHIDDIKHLVSIVNYYKKYDIRVALDDFGAGFASLNLLRQLQPDIIKLDIELVRNIDQDPYKQEIVLHILQMAKKLNIMTLSEGVETMAEKEWLEEHGIQLLQGFLFAKPQAVAVKKIS